MGDDGRLLLWRALVPRQCDGCLQICREYRASRSEQRRIGRREAQTKSADRMAVDRFLANPHHNAGILGHSHPAAGDHCQRAGLMLGRVVAVDRPALPLLPLEHPSRWPTGLFVVGLGTDKFHRHRGGVTGWIDLHLDF